AAGTADQRLFLWNAADGKALAQGLLHGGPVQALAFHTDSSLLLTGGADGRLKLWAVPPVPERIVLREWDAHPGGVRGVAFNGNGAQALTGGADRTVKLWDVAEARMVRSFGPLPDAVTAVAFSRDFTHAVAAAGKTVKLWNVEDGKDLLTL